MVQNDGMSLNNINIDIYELIWAVRVDKMSKYQKKHLKIAKITRMSGFIINTLI